MSATLRAAHDIENDGTHNVAICEIFVDTAADLAGLDHLDDVYFLQGSKATDIDTGDKYMMKSNGTWQKQPTGSAFENVYTKTEIDDIIERIDEYDLTQTLALVHLVNEGGKNRVNPTATSQTINDIAWTINSDGTVTANGTASANSYITLQVLAADSVFDGNYYLSGCPAGGGPSSYALYVARGSYTKYDYGDGVGLTSNTDGLNKNLLAIVYSGQTVNDLTFKPMICKKVYWDISRAYAPYCPTLPELYALVKSYHP